MKQGAFGINKFKINRKLPSLNDYVNVCRRNKYQAADYKSNIEESIGWDIRQALTKGELKPVTKQCDLYIEFHEKTRRRDTDNIQSSTKFIQDAMVKQRILPNDNRKWVNQIYHKVIDSDEDCAYVYIIPAGDIELIIGGKSLEDADIPDQIYLTYTKDERTKK